MPEVDALMQRFCQQHDVGAAAVAVCEGTTPRHAAGYGFVDRARKRPTTAATRFRIASVSKPLTAVTLLLLCRQTQTPLETPIAELLKLEANDGRFARITLAQLLHHTGGFDSQASLDPMFRDVEICRQQARSLPTDPQAILRFMLTRPLDFDPGTKYAYSNFGYFLLGRAVERLADRAGEAKTYEAIVGDRLLRPAGVASMALGRTALAHRAKDEVSYIADRDSSVRSVLQPERPPVAGPYGGFHLEPMAAHGGWIANAVDLVRVAAALRPDDAPLLDGELRQTWLAKPAGIETSAPVHYGAGVQVRDLGSGQKNIWHNGSLDGTNALWVLRHDGWNWAVLFNQRFSREAESKKKRRQLASLIDGPMHTAVNQGIRRNA